MIEFSGYLTGSALKFYFKKEEKTLQNFFIILSLLVVPAFFVVFRNIINLKSILVFLLFPLFAIILPRIVVRLDKKSITKRIYFQDDIVCNITDNITVSRQIEEIQEVHDYGDFYFLILPSINKSSGFLCQKSLLSKGTLEDFEKLFEGKIVRK